MEIDTTSEELEYREERYKDVSEALGEGEIPKCTACHKSIPLEKVQKHPLLEVLMCEDCREFYNEGEFSSDEDGSDKYCRWCGQGGSLYCCSTCRCVFCRKCIKRNCSSSVLDDIEKEDWKCFVCDVKPLWKSRAYCWAVLKKKKEDERLKKSKQKTVLEKLRKQRPANSAAAKRARKGRFRKVSESDPDDPDSDDENSDSASSDSSSPKKSRHSKRPTRANMRHKSDNKSSKTDVKNRNKIAEIIEINSDSDFEDPKPKSKQLKNKHQDKKNKKVIDSDQSSSDSDVKQTKKRGKVQDASSEEERPGRKSSRSVKPKKVQSASDSSDQEASKPNKRVKTQSKTKKVSSEESDDPPYHRTTSKRKKQSDSEEDRNNLKSKNTTSNVANNKNHTSSSAKEKQQSESPSSGDEKEENKSKRHSSPVTIASKQKKVNQDQPNTSHKASTKKTATEEQTESSKDLAPCTSTSVNGDVDVDMDSDATSKDGDADDDTPKLEWLGSLISEFSKVAEDNSGKISQLKELFSDNMNDESVHDACKIIYKQVKKSIKFLDDYKSNIINDYTDWKKRGERRKQRKTKTKRPQDQSEKVSKDTQISAVLSEATISADKVTKKRRGYDEGGTTSENVESEEEESHVKAKGVGKKRNVSFAGDASNNNQSQDAEMETPGDDEDQEEKTEEGTGENNRKDISKPQLKTIQEKTTKKKKETSEDESHTEDESEKSNGETEVPAAEDSQVSVNKDSNNINSSREDSGENTAKDSLAMLEAAAAELREKLLSETLGLLGKTLDTKDVRTSIDPFSNGDDLESDIHDKSTVCGDDIAQNLECLEGVKEKSQDTHSTEDNSSVANHSQSTHVQGDKSVDSQSTVFAEVNQSKEAETHEEEIPQESDSCLNETTQEYLKDPEEKSVSETPSKGKATSDSVISVATDICSGSDGSDSEPHMDVTAPISEAGSDSDARKEDEACKNALIASSTDEEAESVTSSPKSTPRKKKIGPKSKVQKNERSDEENTPSIPLPTKNKIGPKSKVPGSKGETLKEQELRKSKEPIPAEFIANVDEFSGDEKLSSRCSVTLEVLPGEVMERSRQRRSRRQSGYSSDQEIQNLVNLSALEKSHKKAPTAASSKEGDAEKPKRKRSNTKGKKDEEEDLTASENSDGEGESEDNAAKKLLGGPKPLTEDELAARAILVSSDSDDSSTEIVEDEKKKKMKTKTKDEATKDKQKKSPLSDSEDSETEKKAKKRAAWRNDPLLREPLSDLDTDGEEEVVKKVQNRKNKEESSSDEDISIKKKRVKKKVCRKVLDSDSDVQMLDDDDNKSDDDSSDAFVDSNKKKKKKRQHASSDNESSDSSAAARKKRRRRIKQMSNSDSDSDAQDASQRSEGTPGKRKNIRKVLKEADLERATRNAAKEEEERKKRIAERQKLYNEMFDARIPQEGAGSLSELVLDFDPESKKTILEVHKDLVAKLKPHQAQGVKFMWDALFESVERSKKGRGSGCILAHCMGLGKTMQIVVLVHTLLTNPQLELGVRTVLVVTPLSTVNNWCHEFSLWLHKVGEGDEVQIFNVSQARASERAAYLKGWQKQGGVAVMGYDLFRNLSNAGAKTTGKATGKATQLAYQKCLVDPGADLVVCDEGHLLKNEMSKLSQSMSKVKTLRRIVLTGTPLQNNLLEYHCMIQFVKPNLLGKRKEFTNRFVNPIKNGQCLDSTPRDVQVMKRRAHVLHKMLEGSVQRFDYSVLTPLLKPKHEYVIKIRLTELQIKLYSHYLEHLARQSDLNKGASLFSDYQNLQRAWTHPLVMQMRADRQEDKMLDDDAEDSEGSLKDFIDDGDASDSETAASTSSGSASDSDVICEEDSKKRKKKDRDEGKKRYRTRGAVADGDADEVDEEKENKELSRSTEWWNQFVISEDLDNIQHSNKLVMLFNVLRECEAIGDKLLVFSQSLLSLDLIQRFLSMVDEAHRKNESTDHLCGLSGKWVLGADFFRIDGTTSTDNRTMWCKTFNSTNHPRARLFLISTRAGGLGINMIGANRVILFDASWNPSNDVQSIFRIYRFGQVKPCYVYRFLAAGTMEEKIYDRQVTKLALSGRVVDEHQIDRHFNAADLEELYSFNPVGLGENRPTMMVPKDRLLAELLKEHADRIESYHEHDSLLENKPEQNLTEEERQAAWEDYETEKSNQANRIANMEAYQQQMLLQQQQMQAAAQMYQQQQAAYGAGGMPKIDIDMQMALANLVKYAQGNNGNNMRELPGGSGFGAFPRAGGVPDLKNMNYVDQQQYHYRQQQDHFNRMLAQVASSQAGRTRAPAASNSTATLVDLSEDADEDTPLAQKQPAASVDKDGKATLKLRQDLF